VDWPRFRGPQLDGISAESIHPEDWPDPGLAESWRVSVGLGLSNVVVSAGALYTIGNEENVDTVVCLDAATGEAMWSHSYPCATDPNEFDGGPTSTPTVDTSVGAVYTLSRSGDLFCFDASSGEVRWNANVSQLANVRIPAWGFAGSPLVVDDLLILNVGDAGAAVNKRTGEMVWASADKDAGYSSIVPIRLGDRDAVTFGSARSYVAIDPKNGTELWRHRWLTTFGCNAADPIVLDDRLFISSGYHRGSALLKLGPAEPDVLWKSKEMQNQLSTSVLIDECLYGVHGDVDAGASLRCIDTADGAVHWTSEGIRFGALSATQDHLIAMSVDGDLIIVSATPRAFEVLARQKVLDGRCWVSPVLAGGRLYCRDAGGELVCLQTTHSIRK
tara:strand:+ start:312540 stop:313703 length:1164 start_codon:yes stop_codon:yes gene_type:complete